MAMLAPGTLLDGRYRVVRLIGRGGMGAVYEAVQEPLGRRVAVKVLLNADPTFVARFQREAEASAALGHPNIVAVTDFQTPPNEPPFLVMELLTGTSLGSIIDQEGPQPIARVARIASQVLEALGAAHRAGIIHRDVKPDNVFIVQTDTVHDLVKVLDFGIAKLEDPGATAITRLGHVVGSPAYMPPEQARGQTLDARADIYATGATMYHAFTGQMPTGAVPAVTTDGRVSFTPNPSLSTARRDLPSAVTAVVDRAMALEPGDRFATAKEMRDAIAALVESTAEWTSQSTPALAATSQSSQSSQSPQPSQSARQPAAFAPTLPSFEPQGRSTAKMTSAPPVAPSTPPPGRPSLVPWLGGLVALTVLVAGPALWFRNDLISSGDGADSPPASASTSLSAGATARASTSDGAATMWLLPRPAGAPTRLQPLSVSASSEIRNGRETHPAEDAFDGKMDTAWNEGSPGAGRGEWIEATLAKRSHITKIQMTTGYDAMTAAGDLFVLNAHVKELTVSFDGKKVRTLTVRADERWVTIDNLGADATTIRFTIDDVYLGTKWQDLSIAEIELSGSAAADDGSQKHP